MAGRRKTGEGQLGLEGAGVNLLKDAEAARRASELRSIDPRKLVAGLAQPREDFPLDGIGELAESIRAHGVLQPLLVRQRADGTLELLAGERRQRAAVLAGLKKVPVRVLDVSDVTARAITLTENLAREDLSAWEEAVGLARFQESLSALGAGSTRDDVARVVGRSAGAVSESLQIAKRLLPVIDRAGVDRQTLTKLPKTALHGASQGKDADERVRLLRLAAQRVAGRAAPGKAVASAKGARGRPRKGWKVTDRLKDRGTLSFSLRRRPEDLAPREARDVLERLTPIVEALRTRAAQTG